MPSVLIVDDLISIHEMLDAVIQPKGYVTAFATDGEQGLAMYRAGKFDLVLADIDMKPMDGIQLLKELRVYDPTAVVIIMTAYASTDSAVQALKFGAFDFLQKPFRVDELIATLRRGLDFRQELAEAPAPAVSTRSSPDVIQARLVGVSLPIKQLVQQVRQMAEAKAPVLLVGETGSGKRTVAELLHATWAPPGSPLVRVDCSAEEELAVQAGLLGGNDEGGSWLDRASPGTLLLQHVHCLPLAAQARFAQVLKKRAHGMRLVCATTEDLHQLAEQGRFHEELLAEIASEPVLLPPLRERASDIPLLAKHYAEGASNLHLDARVVEFAADALSMLAAYHWPGNLVEFKQVILQVASATETPVITARQLPLRLRDVKQWPSLAEFLAGQQKNYIDSVLGATRGNKAEAAAVLGVDIATIG